MIRRIRRSAAIAVVGLVAASGFAFAPPDDKGQDSNWRTTGNSSTGKKQRTDYSGKALLGDKIRQNGTHKLKGHGKYSASAIVSEGMITGMNVTHADKRDVAVTKYKTTKDMAHVATSGVHFAPYFLSQFHDTGAIWIGYGYIDDWGDESIYWFPYDRIDDGDTDAIEYYATY